MTRRVRSAVILGATLSLFSVVTASPGAARSSIHGSVHWVHEPLTVAQTPKQADQEFDQVLAEEQRLSEELKRIESETETIEARLTELEADVKTSEDDLVAALQAEGAALENVKVQEARAEAARLDVVRTKKLLSQQAIAAYVSGGEESMVGAILRAESSIDAENALLYSEVVIEDTDETAARLEAAEARQKRATAAARRARKSATKHRTDATALTSFLDQARTNQKSLLETAKTKQYLHAIKLEEIKTRKVVLQIRSIALQHASDGAQQLFAAVQAGQPEWKVGSVVMTTPIPGHRIGSQFGMRHHPILGITRLHAGGDMGAANGTPIYAPGDGIVVFAGERGGYGNTTMIDHGHQLGTLYGHQSRLAVAVGDVVKRGDLIGYVGSTGLSTGPHLHFETRILGVPVDPNLVIDWAAPIDYPRP